MKYQQWRLDEKRFLAMTGYTVTQFDYLLPYFADAHNAYLSKYNIKGQKRKGRKFVIYANAPLNSIEERLVFILSYLKLNPIQEQHADMFDMEQRQCNDYIHGLHAILFRSLNEAEVMPAQTPAELSKALIQIVSDEHGDKNILHDGTEREVPRPVDEEEQQEKYSGKKKKHTLKNGIITNALCYVLFVSLTYFGTVHDKKIADDYTIPKGLVLWQDCGFQGYSPDGVTIMQPTKKPRGKELTKEQKEENKKIACYRVRVEHAIGSIKRMRIVKDECRLRKDDINEKLFCTCAALHNMRVKLNPFSYKIKLT